MIFGAHGTQGLDFRAHGLHAHASMLATYGFLKINVELLASLLYLGAQEAKILKKNMEFV